MSHSYGIDEVLRGVIDRLRCSQLPRERLVGSARGGDDVGAASGRQLGRVRADGAGCPHDQNGFAFPDIHRVHKVLAVSPGVGRAAASAKPTVSAFLATMSAGAPTYSA